MSWPVDLARHASLLLSIARPPNLSPVLDPVLSTAETQRCAKLYTHSCFTPLLLLEALSTLDIDNLLLLLVRWGEVKRYVG